MAVVAVVGLRGCRGADPEPHRPPGHHHAERPRRPPGLHGAPDPLPPDGEGPLGSEQAESEAFTWDPTVTPSEVNQHQRPQPRLHARVVLEDRVSRNRTK